MRLGSEIVLILVFLDREILTATLIPFVSVCGCQMIVYYLPACVCVRTSARTFTFLSLQHILSL